MSNYNNQTVYIGIDVHKKTYSIASILNNEILKRDTIPASPSKLIKYIEKHFANYNVSTAYEAGFCGFSLHRELAAHGIKNQVIHPASIEVAARDRVKTDKKDSLKIALQLSRSQIMGIYVPSAQRESYRELTRHRTMLIEDRNRIGNRLKSMLFRLGKIKYNDKSKVCQSWVKKVCTQEYAEYDEYISFTVKSFCELWLNLNQKITEIDKKLKQQAEKDIVIEQIYRSAPGIGPTHARILANELEDMSHFHSEKKLFSFTGLTPSEHSSGDSIRQGHISRQGRAVLRKVLIQAAWIAIRMDKSLSDIYERISKTAGKKKAIVGIARRLIGRIRACFNSGSFYQVTA